MAIVELDHQPSLMAEPQSITSLLQSSHNVLFSQPQCFNTLMPTTIDESQSVTALVESFLNRSESVAPIAESSQYDQPSVPSVNDSLYGQSPTGSVPEDDVAHRSG